MSINWQIKNAALNCHGMSSSNKRNEALLMESTKMTLQKDAKEGKAGHRSSRLCASAQRYSTGQKTNQCVCV